MKDTVCIIGSHPRTREQFDFDRTDCDVWLFNEAISQKKNTWAKRADAIFQMHDPVIWQNPNNRNDPGHYPWLKNQTEVKEIIMQDVYPDVPASTRFPLEEALKLVDIDPVKFFDGDKTERAKPHFLSSSVPQAMALAVLRGYTRVEIYGVAMETTTEYKWQREGVAFWYGFLFGRGVDVYFADPTYICPMYGYDGEVVIPYEAFEERIAELQPQYDEVKPKYDEAVRDVEAAVDNFADGDNEEGHIMTPVFALLAIGQKLGVIDGAIQENNKYKSKADAMKAQSGSFMFSRQEFEGSAAALQEAAEKSRTNFTALGGQLGLIHKTIVNAAKGSPKRETAIDGYKATLQNYLNMSNQMSLYRGAAGENHRYMARLAEGIRAAGGEKSEAAILEQVNA